LVFAGQKSSASTKPDKVLFVMQPSYTGPNSTNIVMDTSGSGAPSPMGRTEVAGSVSPRFYIGDGVSVYNAASQTCIGDQGYGTFSACDIYSANYWMGKIQNGGVVPVPDMNPTIYRDSVSNTIIVAQVGKALDVSVNGTSGGVLISPVNPPVLPMPMSPPPGQPISPPTSPPFIFMAGDTWMFGGQAFHHAEVTVAQLSAITCNGTTTSDAEYVVIDLASPPTFNAVLPGSGGGGNHAQFFCDRTNWRVY
jgi:hypothetical protein